MPQIDNAKVAFAFLRPACVLLTQEQTVKNVQQLGTQLREVSDVALQQLQDYVLFPLRFALKTPGSKKESLVQAVVEAIGYVLANTCVQSWDLLQELFSELCLCLSSPGNPGKPAPLSEDLKAAVLQALDTLLHVAYGDIALQLYEPIMLPGLGAAISLLLALAEHEKSRKVQAAALKCLLILLLKCDCPEPHLWVGQDENCTLGTAFACFLPGITQVLTRVITGDLKQGHAVTVKAIKAWYETVGLVMADEQLSTVDTSKALPGDLGKVRDLLVKRTQTWVKETSEKLAILLKKIISCTSAHQHWKVRFEMVKLSEHLLSTCQNSLKECISPLLEALVGKVNDQSSAVRDECSAALELIALRNQAGDDHNFTDVLSENLHSLTTSLPRLMRTSDDQHKLFILNVFLGYLKVLGPKVTIMLNSATHLQRISKALMQVLELDVTDVCIVEERSSTSLVDAGPRPLELYIQKKHFLYFTDANIFSLLQQICRLLGYFGNLYLLVDHFMDLYRESSVYRKQCSLVLNEMITGAAGMGLVMKLERSPVSKDELKASVMSIIEEYTSLSNWNLATSSAEPDQGEEGDFTHLRILSITNSVRENENLTPPAKKRSTLYQRNSNIWQICIQLEGIGCFALALGVDFQTVLMTALYPVLEKAGDETLLISQSALCSMWDICQACGYSSLRELINLNSDYLLNDISLNLHRLSLHPHAPRVLTVMFCHSDASLLPLLGDVIQDVLTALDLSYDERAPVFCTVLYSLMKALVRWFPPKLGEKKSSDLTWSRCEEPLDVRQFLLDHHRLKQQAEGLLEDSDTGDVDAPSSAPNCNVDLEEPDKKPELPSHITLAKDVLERCLNLLSDPSLQVRLKVLDVLELCVCVLHCHEDVLLPLAHRCWPALLQRLTSDNPLAVLRAFKVLCTLGETCGDFLRRRVSQEVLPQLTDSLQKQALVSAKAGPVYTHTLAFKLQLAVLEGLGTLCLRLDLADSDLDVVSQACISYLSCRQPAKLQEACVSLFHHLIKVDPDAVWFTLNELYCPQSYEPRHPDLHAVCLTGTGKPRNEYTNNVVRLLGKIC